MVRLGNSLSPESAAIKGNKLATIKKTSLLASTALLLTLGASNPAWSVPFELDDVGDFAKIAQGGFRQIMNGNYPALENAPNPPPAPFEFTNDVGHSSYAWSQSWYDVTGVDPAYPNDPALYVGTVRDVLCAAGVSFPLTAPCAFEETDESALLPLPFGPDQRAEMWRYDPSLSSDFGGANGSWTQVYQSPMNGFTGQAIDTGSPAIDGLISPFIVGLFDNIPRDVGYRNQAVCNTLGETERKRLYATTSGVPGNILRMNDAGTSLEPTNTDGLKAGLSTFLPAEVDLPDDILGGITINLGGTSNGDIGYRGLACFNGYLITSPASSVDSDAEDVSENPFLMANADPSDSGAWEALVDFRNFPSIDFNRDADFTDTNEGDCADCGQGSALGDEANYGAFDMIIMDGDLWIAVSNRGKDTILAYDGNGDPILGTPDDSGGVELWRGDGANFGTECGETINNKPGACTGIEWTKVIDVGAGRREDNVGPDVDNALGTFGVLNGELYMGLWESGFEDPSLAEMIRVTPNSPGDEEWELLIGGGRLDYETDSVVNGTDATGEMMCDDANRYNEDSSTALITGPDCYPSSGRHVGMGSVQAVGTDQYNGTQLLNEGVGIYFWRMIAHRNADTSKDELYMGTFEGDSVIDDQGTPNPFTGGFSLYKTTESDAGDSWSTLTEKGFLNPYNYGVRSFQSVQLADFNPATRPDDWVLFLGTANPFTNVPDVAGTEDYSGGAEVYMGTFDPITNDCTDCLAGPPVAVINTASTFIFGDALACTPPAIYVDIPGVYTGCVIGSSPTFEPPFPGPVNIDGSSSYAVHGATIANHEWFMDTKVDGTSGACDSLSGSDGTGPIYAAALPAGQLKGTGDGSGEYDITLRVQDNDLLYTCKSIHMIVSTDLPPTAEITEAYIPYPSNEVHLFSVDGDPVTFDMSGTCSDPYVDGNDNPPYNLDSCTWSSSVSGSLDDPNALSTTATLPVSAQECQTFPGFGTFCELIPEQIALTASDNPNGFTDSETLDVYVYSTLDDGDTETDMPPVCQNGSFRVVENATLEINPVDTGNLVCTDPDGDDAQLRFNLSGPGSQTLDHGTIEETAGRTLISYQSTGGTGIETFAFRAETDGGPSGRPRTEFIGMTITVVPAAATIDISKSVLSGPLNTENDTMTVTYQISATNRGVADGSYDIIESIEPGTGITVSTTTPPTITYDPSNTDGQSSTEVSPFSGQPGASPELVVDDEIIAGVGAGLGTEVVETWTVTVVYDVDKDLLENTNTSGNCTDPSNSTGGSGFTNIVTSDVPTGDDGSNKACAWLPLEEESDILFFMPAIISGALQSTGS